MACITTKLIPSIQFNLVSAGAPARNVKWRLLTCQHATTKSSSSFASMVCLLPQPTAASSASAAVASQHFLTFIYGRVYSSVGRKYSTGAIPSVLRVPIELGLTCGNSFVKPPLFKAYAISFTTDEQPWKGIALFVRRTEEQPRCYISVRRTNRFYLYLFSLIYN